MIRSTHTLSYSYRQFYNLKFVKNMKMLHMKDVSKRFTLHHQNGVELKVLNGVNLSLIAGECVVLDGPSGMGKSTLLKLAYANYHVTCGTIEIKQFNGQVIELTQATPREILKLRSDTVGYVSQFLRVIPRVSALDIVAEPLIDDLTSDSIAAEHARDNARTLLSRLRIPERLWGLPPATFSGGEQQRINIARNMIKPKPLLLLDEPTASLDAANTATVIELIHEAISRGTAVLGIFHDTQVGATVATRHIDIAQFRSAA